MVLFPKAIERQRAGKDARPLLLLTIGLVMASSAVVTLLYFALPEWIMQTVFGVDFSLPFQLLGLIGIATSLFAAINIWLQYALSLKRRNYVLVLCLIVVAQFVALLIWNDSVMQIATALVGAGVAGNLAGLIFSLTEH